MEQIAEMIKEKAMEYAQEAFAGYEGEVFAAFDCILTCRLEARRSGLLALEDIAEGWQEEEEIPLKPLLLDLVQGIVDASDIDTWEEKAYRRILEEEYSGYEWYIADLYVTGCKNIFMGISNAQYYHRCRTMVPERWQEDFDYWTAWTKEGWERNEAHMEEWARWTFQKEAAIRAAFHRRLGTIEAEELERIAKELPDQVLAAALAGAGETLRNRFLEQMSEEQKKDIMEEWYANRSEEYCLRDIEEAMEQVTMAVGLMGADGK